MTYKLIKLLLRIFFLTNIVLLISSRGEVQALNIKNREPKRLFDTSMEKIEKAIMNNQRMIVCKESKKSLKILKTNRSLLYNLEPYYDWSSIKDVIHLNINDYC